MRALADACSQHGALNGRTFDVLGPSRAVFRHSWGAFGWSRGDLGRSPGILGAVLGHAVRLGGAL